MAAIAGTTLRYDSPTSSLGNLSMPVSTAASGTGPMIDEFAEQEVKKGGKRGRGGGVWIFVSSAGSGSREDMSPVWVVAAVAGGCVMVF